MAFLDNTGTIKIDAVLTDVGRKRMAQGQFMITKFALGDDELDYSFVDTSDLTEESSFASLKTFSMFEAFAEKNAVITYQLRDFRSDDILYIPQIKINEKISESVKKDTSSTSTFYYLGVNVETTKKLKTLMGKRFYLENESSLLNKLVFEAGIHSDTSTIDLPHTQKARERYLLNYNLYDKYFIINCDNRFVDKLLVVDPKDTKFENDASNNMFYNFQTLRPIPPVSLKKITKYFDSYIVPGIDNEIFPYAGIDDNRYSAINGPRSTIGVFNLKVIDELTGESTTTRDFRYLKFGEINKTLFGGSDKFDYIDTVLRIEGTASGATLQVPIRILRYAGT